MIQGEVDLSEGKSEAGLANSIDLLLHLIGCIKDHYDAFVEGKVGLKKASSLLKQGGPAAIVQDLWNRSKHPQLNKECWSGKFPSLGQVQQTMSFDVRGIGEVGWRSKPMTMELSAFVFSRDGTIHGDINNLMLQAVSEWENFFRENGLSIVVKLPE